METSILNLYQIKVCQGKIIVKLITTVNESLNVARLLPNNTKTQIYINMKLNGFKNLVNLLNNFFRPSGPITSLTGMNYNPWVNNKKSIGFKNKARIYMN